MARWYIVGFPYSYLNLSSLQATQKIVATEPQIHGSVLAGRWPMVTRKH